MLQATRTRSASNDFVALATPLCGAALVGSLVVRELRVASGPFSPAAERSSGASVPAEAVSVPRRSSALRAT